MGNNETSNKTEENPLFDIIQNLQSKLSNNSENVASPTPITSTNDSSELNLTGIMDMLKNVGMNKTDTENNNNINNSGIPNLSNLNIDLNTIMKFQRFFSSMNKEDPRKNLLTSLKPFMRETRQKNVDTYITLLGVISALDIFTNKGSE